MSTSRSGADEVHRITNAPESLSVDQSRRERRYLAQMGVRVVCFILAVATIGRVPGWVTGILLVGAVVLPYVAVILANAGRERRDEEAFAPEPRRLGAAPTQRGLGTSPDPTTSDRPGERTDHRDA